MPDPASAAAWPVGPPLAFVAAAALLYWLGGRRRAPRRRGRAETGRTAAFALGLLSIAAALDSPLDPLAERSFGAHMAQHVLLLAVAPPLVVLSAPWMRIWQPFPLALRRRVARTVVRSRRLRAAGHALGHPVCAWTLPGAALVVWHVPALYDLAIRNQAVHDLEHALYLSTGLLFWGAIVDSPPFHARLGWLWRAAFSASGMLVGWVLALVLAFAPTPLYPAYASLAHRPGGLTAIADQQLAAGVMWVPGSLAYTVAVVLFFYRWLDPSPTRRRLGLAGR